MEYQDQMTPVSLQIQFHHLMEGYFPTSMILLDLGQVVVPKGFSRLYLGISNIAFKVRVLWLQ